MPSSRASSRSFCPELTRQLARSRAMLIGLVAIMAFVAILAVVMVR
jgi:hypothetical protein